jgi:hypothetical protein
MADESQEIIPPKEMFNRLSAALIGLARSDPLLSLTNEIELRFQWVHTQLAAMEKATDLQHQDMVRVPTLLQTSTQTIREIQHHELQTVEAQLRGRLDAIYAEIGQKFLGIDSQFDERDTRTDQRAGDTKLAVDAAFAAAKEATAKIEAGFKEQIKALTDLVDTKTGQLAQQIGDLKDRVIAMESRGGGQSSLVMGAAVVLSALVGFSALIFAVFRHA